MTNSFDFASLRNEFPVTKRMLYLDSAHQTPMASVVRTALYEFLVEGNEFAGPKPVWVRRVETARENVAKLFNASPSEIAFTKNTSEGLNIAANAVPFKAGDNVVLIEGDHPNNAYAWLNLRSKGVEVRFVMVNDNEIANASTFEPYIDRNTKVISLSHVTFHAGQRHDVADIGKLCASKSIYLVLDVMQSVGVLPLDVKELGVSMMAAGVHKGLLTPQGLGVLYVKEGLNELQPAYIAMSSLANPPEDYIARPDDMAPRKDAGRFEMGNYNLPDLHALSAAIGLINKPGPARIEQHMLALGDRLIAGLDELGIELIGPRTRTKRVHIYVLNLPVREWMDFLSQNQVRVSPERGGIRISFGVFNSLDDVESVLNLLRERCEKIFQTKKTEQID